MGNERSLLQSWTGVLDKSSGHDTPVTRVVNLLKEMGKTVQAEMDEDSSITASLTDLAPELAARPQVQTEIAQPPLKQGLEDDQQPSQKQEKKKKKPKKAPQEPRKQSQQTQPQTQSEHRHKQGDRNSVLAVAQAQRIAQLQYAQLAQRAYAAQWQAAHLQSAYARQWQAAQAAYAVQASYGAAAPGAHLYR